MDSKLKEYLAVVEAWAEKYPKEVVRKTFASYISDARYEEMRLPLTYRHGLTVEKNIRLDFAQTLSNHFWKDLPEEEQRYRIWTDICWARSSNQLTDEMLEEYSGHWEWSVISSSKDITVDFIERHKDNIVFKNICVDLGEEFAHKYWDKLGDALRFFKLSKEDTFKAVKEKKLGLSKLDTYKGTWGYSDLIDLLKIVRPYDLSEALCRFQLNAQEKIKLLDWMDSNNYSFEEDSSYNSLIATLLDDPKLTLQEKKDIKYYAIL